MLRPFFFFLTSLLVADGAYLQQKLEVSSCRRLMSFQIQRKSGVGIWARVKPGLLLVEGNCPIL